MISCPNCGHQNVTGAAFCIECGVGLLSVDTVITHKMEMTPESVRSWAAAPPMPSPVSGGDNWVTLHLLDTGQVLPLTDRNEFTLGRVVEGQPVMPDLDLTPYHAYSHGVSRLHATIRRGVDDVYLMDLESANGTFVNGRRLEANEECPLSNGDVVALGGLKVQILLKSP
ncbi:MAG TPA: FHA domain-containing protein [Anaerolineales bacterium]